MAVPSYTTDLVDIDLCEAGGKIWAEPTAAGWTLGAAPASDDDNPFQGSLAMSKAFNAAGVGGMMVNNGAGITLPTDGAFLGWFFWAAPGSLEADIDGGIRIMVGTDLANFLSWDVGGKTTYIYGGWINYAVNTTLTPDDTVGTGLGNSQYTGAAVNNFNSIFKGNPFVSDAYRYGRCESRMSGGQSANYATFNGYAAINDAVANRWGLIQAITGGYLVKGLVLFGFSTKTTTFRSRTTNVATLTTSVAHGFVVGDTVIITGVGGTGYNATAVITVVGTTTTFSYANTGSDEGSTADTGGSINGVVDFRDANKSIVIQNTNKVTANFNVFEVRNVSSRVDLTAIIFTNLGTVSKARWETTDNADVNIDSCVFTDMGTFIFLSNSTINNSTFRRTGQITTNGAVFTGCTFDNNTAATNVMASSPANAALISNTTFVSDGTGHGLEITGTAANMTLTGDTWTGYAAGNGSTGNEAVYVNIVSGSMNLTISGGTTPSIRTAGASVTVISGAVDATVTVKDSATPPVAIENARVLVIAASGGPMPYDATVTITRSVSTATVTHTAHGMVTNDKVQIKGANQQEYNGVYTITKIDNDSYSYTVSGTPDTPATGTIKATYAALYGLTNVSGVITMSRVFASNQPISGRVRKSTGTPFYKTADFIGTINSTTGFSSTIQMIPDV